MTRFENLQICQEYFEYHGNTEIVRIRRRGKRTISREWICFDSVEEAQACFNSHCGL